MDDGGKITITNWKKDNTSPTMSLQELGNIGSLPEQETFHVTFLKRPQRQSQSHIQIHQYQDSIVYINSNIVKYGGVRKSHDF